MKLLYSTLFALFYSITTTLAASAVYTSTALLTNPIPVDGSAVEVTEGTQILSVDFAASSATAEVTVFFVATCTHPTGDNALVAALFVDDDTTARHVAAINPAGADYGTVLTLLYTFVPGTTDTQTYKVRVGTTSGSMRCNAWSYGGVTTFGGGAMKSTLTVTETDETAAAIGQWRMVTADTGVSGRDGAGVVSYRGDLYSLGGWNPNNTPATTNEFLKSTDGGRTWAALPTPPWAGRHTVGWGVFNDKITAVGGDANSGYYIEDIWTWTPEDDWLLANASPPWTSPGRVLFQTVFTPGLVAVIGGQTLDEFVVPSEKANLSNPFYADVWVSTDLVNWTKVSDNNIFAPCVSMIGQAVLDGRVYLVCGGQYNTAGYPRTYADKFYSAPLSDLSDWRLEATPPWGGTLYSSLTVYRDEIWKIGGNNGTDQAEAWRFKPGRGWLPVSAPFFPRHAHSAFTHDNALKLMYGPLGDPSLWEMR